MILDTLVQTIVELELHVLKNNEKEVVDRLVNIELFANAISGSSGLEGAFSEHLTLVANTIEACFFEEHNDLAILGSSELIGYVDGVRFVYEPSIKKREILSTFAANAQEGEDYLNEGDIYHTNFKIRYFMGFATGLELALNHTTEGNDFKLITDEDNPEDIYKGFEYFPNSNSIKVDGRGERLSDHENKLLQYLVIHADTELNIEEIIEGAWEGLNKDKPFFYNTIKGLRDKIQPTQLGPQFIYSRRKGRIRFSIRLDRIYRPQVEYDPERKGYKSRGVPIELRNNKPRKILDVIREYGSNGATDREIVDKVWSPQSDIIILKAPMSTLGGVLSNANPMLPCPLYNEGQSYRVIGFK